MKMPDSKKMIEILIIVVGGAYLLYRIFALMDTKQALPGPAPAGPEMAGLSENANKTAQSDRKLKDAAGRARDIFQKPDGLFTSDAKAGIVEAPKTQDDALSLEGTMWGAGKNVAILSGMVVAEGDIIQGGKVIRIEPDRVIIVKDGIELEIKRGA
jgi:hypothetical protein